MQKKLTLLLLINFCLSGMELTEKARLELPQS